MNIKNDIDVIIQNLKSSLDSTSESKKQLSGYTIQLGKQEEQIESAINLWEEMKGQNVTPPQPITASGVALTYTLQQSSQDLKTYVSNQSWTNQLQALGTTALTINSVAASGASLSYPPGYRSQALVQVNLIEERYSQRSAISQKLYAIDQSLGQEYDNAWQTLHQATQDPTRSPMFLMREVERRLLDYFAPEIELRKYHSLVPSDKITGRHKVDYLKSIIKPSAQTAFLAQEQALNNIYALLSKAHSPGQLDIEKTKAFLYQADALIQLLLDSF
ncbi:MAG: hypothetical protein UX99_C0016G0007 [Candidatus Amesbacteria bacterium GW2011_GWB1_47_26]|uniref:Uncharacterized protein n=1 Tax=Candidatus Amesbacteria bacterium GW2011_GWC2_45_19 TaxID=1618366 RepID=A0A0G1M5C6_9BACT|nr:MAG: hypothetical protein UX05_C0002G0063 [Candidatus Amesbacteria bacterium GW2011_GWC2_45_19]KKU37571.1 MAG: hypothetical protein UX52_C0022G0007 [Candidatus Amesbacteria bacterium GW2011_GWA1_46_35]KKU68936.1 MAG: hypothetical protein UX93_C0004G0007 [Microgenomates group bacterium GW2011_GWC1_47_20]KKU74367.1 MAG: hypothetical protein UX99_C0016G0007 [Candidatus Amesbacteria bacterium GW2011_GWB1_47_26]KKU78772.1 MAG: hypothetical protein UY06_C0040G0002 [Candidatus Amesbacteria bacteriu